MGIAPGDNDLSIRVVAYGLSDSLPGLHGSFVGDRAGVDDADLSSTVAGGHGVVYACVAGIHQPFGDFPGFVLIDLAAQGGDGEFGLFFGVFFHIYFSNIGNAITYKEPRRHEDAKK